ncbi:MAG: hypothetical protein A3K19_18515 [Lentisphaerae bacterium RIFOXYB12_FULL_65_16]|nr:MAG: hypothetical protein A3K18_13770 [Lentisphaerae bacterium RIFOXYA12_64_32]OGV92956.1 MAG: hypothetical protein A3K19_18515 [Lentisphaerae bacterium RIFOXYB12_FULL_65_16]
MDKTGCWELTTGGWEIRFAADSATLECRHTDTNARIAGVVGFEHLAGDKATAWTVAPPRDGVHGRLALLDAQQNVQGYLVPQPRPDKLSLTVIHRTAQSYSGRLRFDGTATLGRDTFACRTRPNPASPVVQMASGPADSALNDSLFDGDTDTLLRFSGATVQLRTRPTADSASVFEFQLLARPEQAAESSLVFEIEPDFYCSRYVPHYRPIDKTRCPSPPTGWMSWNVYFDQAGEKENLDEARVGARDLQRFGLDIWSIESWQANSDKLPVSVFHNLTLEPHPGQFPHGMKWLADQIRALGFKPGIWTVPFGTGSREFYEAHKGWFLHDAQGNPMRNWCGTYLLDPSQPEVREHMRSTHRTMSHEWGYEFFKIDGMSGRSAGYCAHFYERPEVRAAMKYPCDNPFALCCQALREGIGPDRILLACQGHYTGPDVAVSDAARTGGDIVSPNQPPKWHNILNQANATLNQLFVHNVVWYADPDTLMVGAFHSLDVARIATAVVALPGQMMFAGDKLGELSAERMRLLQQALPVCDVRPLDLFPIFELKSVWDLKITRPFGAWDVVCLFNWTDADATVGFTIADLGLPRDERKYLLFDFWAQRFLGEFAGGFQGSLPPHSCRLLAVHSAAGRPQFLSTDRHITQGGTCLRALAWDDASCALTGETELVANHAQTLFVHVPAGYALQRATADGTETVQAEMGGDGVLTLTLKRAATGTAAWRLQFARM